MNLSVQKRIASELLKCGEGRVWLDPEREAEISRAITREDLRRLIKKGFVKKKQIKGTSRGHARKVAEKKKKGRRRGPGSRKGTRHAILSKKKRWSIKIRAQRKFLRALKESKEVTRSLYRQLYLKAKGGVFRSKAHIQNFIDQVKERNK